MTDIPPAPDWFRPKRRKKQPAWTRSHDSALQAAQIYSVDMDQVLANMPLAWEFLAQERELLDAPRRSAVEITKLNSERCNLWEDSGRDHSTRPGFDVSAREIATLHPELGLDPHDTDTPAVIWDLIKRGAPSPLLKSGRECAMLAAEWIVSAQQSVRDEFDELPDLVEDDDDCDCSFNPDDWETPSGEISEDVPSDPATDDTELEESTYDDDLARGCVFVRTSWIVPHYERIRRYRQNRGQPIAASVPGLRRYGWRQRLDRPASRAGPIVRMSG
jgi:hypothetical protein